MKYIDKKTGLVIRKINYDSKEEIFADIRVIENSLPDIPLQGKIPYKFAKYLQIGEAQRGAHEEKDFNIYVILDNFGVISTSGVLLWKLNGKTFPIFSAGMVESNLDKLTEVCGAIIRMLRIQYSRVFIFILKGKGVLKDKLKLKGFTEETTRAETWEVDTDAY